MQALYTSENKPTLRACSRVASRIKLSFSLNVPDLNTEMILHKIDSSDSDEVLIRSKEYRLHKCVRQSHFGPVHDTVAETFDQR